MTTETMTLTQALVEIKTLNERISKATMGLNNLMFIKKGKGSKKGVSGLDISKMEKEAQAAYDSVNGLIVRRDAIKRELVNANAQNKVTIGEDEYTIAAAIERKNSIEFDKAVLVRMETNYAVVQAEYTRELQKVNAELDKQIASVFGSGDRAAQSTEIEQFRTNYLNNNAPELVDPIRLKDKIDALDKRISDFETKVDVAISVVNAKTEITVTY